MYLREATIDYLGAPWQGGTTTHPRTAARQEASWRKNITCARDIFLHVPSRAL